MIHKKVNTLLIPFIIWNVIGALCLLPFDKKAVGTNVLSVIQICSPAIGTVRCGTSGI